MKLKTLFFLFILSSCCKLLSNPFNFDCENPLYKQNLSDSFFKELSRSANYISNGPRPFFPYSPCEFTKISKEEIEFCKFLTVNPKWAKFQNVEEYYRLHEETQYDRNLCILATYLMGTIVHGWINQEELAAQLNLFNIRKLLKEGPQKKSILSVEAQKLIYDSLHDVDHVLDIHLHNLGYDEGNFLNPKIAAHAKASYKNYFTFMVMRYASGMSFVKGSTHEARKRIHLYAGHFPKLTGMVLPIHKAFRENGEIDWNSTGNFLKNHAAIVTARTFDNRYGDSEIFSAISVHPFDPRWREKLLSAYEKGIRLVKWMPPQSIPPDSDLVDDYYLLMKKLNMTLIAHAGEEHVIPTDKSNQQWEDWGNPLRFRKPLQLGVNVILAHSGHSDPLIDLDDPNRTKKPGYQLFIRLAREAHQKNLTGEWTGKLYGDLAAVTTHYGPDFIKELLKVANEEGIRLIYGSDYPYTNLIQPGKDAYEICAAAGILNSAYVAPLKEIRAWNPLLANYVFTKNLEMTLENGRKARFPEETFTGRFKDGELLLVDKSQWDRSF